MWIRSRKKTGEPQSPWWIHESQDQPDQQETKEPPGRPPVSPSVRRLRQLLGSKPVAPVAPFHLQRTSPATASSRRFIRPGVVRQLQAQFENLARQH